MSILAFAEQRNGAFRKSGFEVVSEAKRLADKLGTTVSALVVGSGVEKQSQQMDRRDHAPPGVFASGRSGFSLLA